MKKQVEKLIPLAKQIANLITWTRSPMTPVHVWLGNEIGNEAPRKCKGCKV
jgi:hypothetical protein